MSGFEGFRFAHRGLFGKEIPENSLAAFRKALDYGFGVEFDVHLMKDGSLAVIHDASLMRTVGENKNICELDAAEIADLRLEGTDEKIPLLEETLQLFKGKVPLIIELKVDNGNYAELCEAVCRVLDGYEGTYCLESFDPRCILWLKRNRPEVIRGLLSQNYFRKSELKSFWLKAFLTLLCGNFIYRPAFIAYRISDRRDIPYNLCRKLWKIKGVSWTVTTPEQLRIAETAGELPIFEGFIPENKQKNE